MQIEFYKYQGTGNDFVIVDNRRDLMSLKSVEVKWLCDRRFGIGADGLMFLNPSEDLDFEMKYYNADGNEGSMCGNGGRCIVKFASDIGIKKSDYTFIASDGLHKAFFDEDGWVHLNMKNVNEPTRNEDDFILDTGSPHYIKIVNGINQYDVVTRGKEIRYNKVFREKGINVNFVERQPGKIVVRTYERGVEDETYSCGTGVTASALVCAHNSNGFNRVEVETLGGKLAVEFNKIEGGTFENIWLCGPAVFVFKGIIEVG